MSFDQRPMTVENGRRNTFKTLVGGNCARSLTMIDKVVGRTGGRQPHWVLPAAGRVFARRSCSLLVLEGMGR